MDAYKSSSQALSFHNAPRPSLCVCVCVCVYVVGSLGPLAVLDPSPLPKVLAKLSFVSLSVASAFQLGLELPLQQLETITILGVAGYAQAIRWTVVHVGEGGDEGANVGRGL